MGRKRITFSIMPYIQCANCKRWDGPKAKGFGPGRHPPPNYIDPAKIDAAAKVCDLCYFDIDGAAWPAAYYVANGVRPSKEVVRAAPGPPSSVRPRLLMLLRSIAQMILILRAFGFCGCIL
jgi:hypothetical protein